MSLTQVEANAVAQPGPTQVVSAFEGPKGALRGYLSGLAGHLLGAVIIIMLLAQALFYVTRVTMVQDNWAHDRIAAATAVADAFVPKGAFAPPEIDLKILASIGARAMVIDGPAGARVFAADRSGDFEGRRYDVQETNMFDSLRFAAAALFGSQDQPIVIRGAAPDGERTVMLKLDPAPLRLSLVRVSRTFLALAVFLSGVGTLVLWAVSWWFVVRPVRRLTDNILAFAQSAEKQANVIRPSGRRDEIGRAEHALAGMQTALADELRQRKRLAELGMAVARVSHDLRNILSAAQLISDRIATIPDPLAQRLAPRLVRTLDRAIAFCQATLSYGAGREREPDPINLDLRLVVRQIVETAEAERPGSVAYAIDIPPKFEVFADAEHVLRVIENLNRNARQALTAAATPDRPPAVRFAAIRAEGGAIIEISDNGPGFPEAQQARIFEPFHSSASAGGSGLGLAIAADLIQRNGGSIILAPSLEDDFYRGARFLIRLPTPAGAAATLAPSLCGA